MNDRNPDAYRLPYLHLFNDVSDAISAIDACNYGEARDLLVQAQQRTEALFIDNPRYNDGEGPM